VADSFITPTRMQGLPLARTTSTPAKTGASIVTTGRMEAGLRTRVTVGKRQTDRADRAIRLRYSGNKKLVRKGLNAHRTSIP
jgi:hypothetical protein